MISSLLRDFVSGVDYIERGMCMMAYFISTCLCKSRSFPCSHTEDIGPFLISFVHVSLFHLRCTISASRTVISL